MDANVIPPKVYNGLRLPQFIQKLWWARDVNALNEALGDELQTYTTPGVFPDLFRTMIGPHSEEMIRSYGPIKSEFLYFRDQIHQDYEEMDESMHMSDINMRPHFTASGSIYNFAVKPHIHIEEIAEEMSRASDEYRDLVISKSSFLGKIDSIMSVTLEKRLIKYQHPILKVVKELWKKLPEAGGFEEVTTAVKGYDAGQPGTLYEFTIGVNPPPGDYTDKRKFISYMRYISRTIAVIKGYRTSKVYFHKHSEGVYSLQVSIGHRADAPSTEDKILYTSHMMVFTVDFPGDYKGCLFIPAKTMNEKRSEDYLDINYLKITPIFGGASTGYTRSIESELFLRKLQTSISMTPPSPFSYVDKYGQLINVRSTKKSRDPADLYDETDTTNFSNWPEICAPYMLLGLNWPCVGIPKERFEGQLTKWPYNSVTEQLVYTLTNLFCNIVAREGKLFDLLFTLIKDEQAIRTTRRRSPIPFKLMIYLNSTTMEFEHRTFQKLFYEEFVDKLGIDRKSPLQQTYSFIRDIAPIDGVSAEEAVTPLLEVDAYKNLIKLDNIIAILTQEKSVKARKTFMRELALRSLQKTNGLMFFMNFLFRGRDIDNGEIRDKILKRIFDDKVELSEGLSEPVYARLKTKVSDILLEKFRMFRLIKQLGIVTDPMAELTGLEGVTEVIEEGVEEPEVAPKGKTKEEKRKKQRKKLKVEIPSSRPVSPAMTVTPTSGPSTPMPSPTESVKAMTPTGGPSTPMPSPSESVKAMTPTGGPPTPMPSPTESVKAMTPTGGPPTPMPSPSESVKAMTPTGGPPTPIPSPSPVPSPVIPTGPELQQLDMEQSAPEMIRGEKRLVPYAESSSSEGSVIIRPRRKKAKQLLEEEEEEEEITQPEPLVVEPPKTFVVEQPTEQPTLEFVGEETKPEFVAETVKKVIEVKSDKPPRTVGERIALRKEALRKVKKSRKILTKKIAQEAMIAAPFLEGTIELTPEQEAELLRIRTKPKPISLEKFLFEADKLVGENPVEPTPEQEETLKVVEKIMVKKKKKMSKKAAKSLKKVSEVKPPKEEEEEKKPRDIIKEIQDLVSPSEEGERILQIIYEAYMVDDKDVIKSQSEELIEIMRNDQRLMTEGPKLVEQLLKEIKTEIVNEEEVQLNGIISNMLHKLTEEPAIFKTGLQLIKMIDSQRYNNIDDLLKSLSLLTRDLDDFPTMISMFAETWNRLNYEQIRSTQVEETQMEIKQLLETEDVTPVGPSNRSIILAGFDELYSQGVDEVMVNSTDDLVTKSNELGLLVQGIMTEEGMNHLKEVIQSALKEETELSFTTTEIRSIADESVEDAIAHLFNFDSFLKFKLALANVMRYQSPEFEELYQKHTRKMVAEESEVQAEPTVDDVVNPAMEAEEEKQANELVDTFVIGSVKKADELREKSTKYEAEKKIKMKGGLRSGEERRSKAQAEATAKRKKKRMERVETLPTFQEILAEEKEQKPSKMVMDVPKPQYPTDPSMMLKEDNPLPNQPKQFQQPGFEVPRPQYPTDPSLMLREENPLPDEPRQYEQPGFEVPKPQYPTDPSMMLKDLNQLPDEPRQGQQPGFEVPKPLEPLDPDMMRKPPTLIVPQPLEPLNPRMMEEEEEKERTQTIFIPERSAWIMDDDTEMDKPPTPGNFPTTLPGEEGDWITQHDIDTLLEDLPDEQPAFDYQDVPKPPGNYSLQSDKKLIADIRAKIRAAKRAGQKFVIVSDHSE